MEQSFELTPGFSYMNMPWGRVYTHYTCILYNLILNKKCLNSPREMPHEIFYLVEKELGLYSQKSNL